MAVAIAKLDVVLFILGIRGGIFIFGTALASFTKFNLSGVLGSQKLPRWFNLNTGIIVSAVVLLAVGAF